MSLAGLGIFASVVLAAYAFGVILFPDTTDFFYVGMLPMFVYEVSLGTWLLLKGNSFAVRGAA